jgi:hypothetical protein
VPVPLQTSPRLHGLPSLQAVPAGANVPTQYPDALHASPVVQPLPSLHEVPAGRCV